MPIDERMKLAEGRPLPRKLFAAMAQQDCGQCGYLCETYSAAIAAGAETKLNLCVPGGKETSRMLKRLLEEAPAPVLRRARALHASGQSGGRTRHCRERPVEAVFRSATRLNGAGSEKDTRHVVFDISAPASTTRRATASASAPANDPALADAVLAAMRAPPDFPVGGKTLPPGADRGLRAGRWRPTCCSS